MNVQDRSPAVYFARRVKANDDQVSFARRLTRDNTKYVLVILMSFILSQLPPRVRQSLRVLLKWCDPKRGSIASSLCSDNFGAKWILVFVQVVLLVLQFLFLLISIYNYKSSALTKSIAFAYPWFQTYSLVACEEIFTNLSPRYLIVFFELYGLTEFVGNRGHGANSIKYRSIINTNFFPLNHAKHKCLTLTK